MEREEHTLAQCKDTLISIVVVVVVVARTMNSNFGCRTHGINIISSSSVDDY